MSLSKPTNARQTFDLAVDRWRLVTAIIFDVDFHDAVVLGEHIGEIRRTLVAVEDAAGCAALGIHLGSVSQRHQIIDRQLWANPTHAHAFIKSETVTVLITSSQACKYV